MTKKQIRKSTEETQKKASKRHVGVTRSSKTGSFVNSADAARWFGENYQRAIKKLANE